MIILATVQNQHDTLSTTSCSLWLTNASVYFVTLPAERARVGLAPLPGMKGTDYINASYIMVRVALSCSTLAPVVHESVIAHEGGDSLGCLICRVSISLQGRLLPTTTQLFIFVGVDD